MEIRWFGRDPALWLAAISAGIGILVTFNFTWLSDGQAEAIVTAVTAVFGLIAALAVRPIAVQAFTTAIGSLAVALAAYGFEIPRETVGAIQAFVVVVLALAIREKITPNHDPRPLPSDARVSADRSYR